MNAVTVCKCSQPLQTSGSLFLQIPAGLHPLQLTDTLPVERIVFFFELSGFIRRRRLSRTLQKVLRLNRFLLAGVRPTALETDTDDDFFFFLS